ncbi:hypothetical protein CMP1-64 [Clavibacter phage CMP1]|uniref:Uncharacterized protein n=1 Tax=Clavibacter phage CMP1 TaxID=686439 RepID=D0U248_9CAUD|nr:hypothetical protein CMP1-64 [Clavibacter phage CMP1]ACY35956.1 hypothetical protein CMP1-64 [Clavibacter phage CMP1]
MQPGYPHSTNHLEVRTRQETITPPIVIEGQSFNSRIRITAFCEGQPTTITELGDRDKQFGEEAHRLAALSVARVPERITTVTKVTRKQGGYLFTITALK